MAPDCFIFERSATRLGERHSILAELRGPRSLRAPLPSGSSASGSFATAGRHTWCKRRDFERVVAGREMNRRKIREKGGGICSNSRAALNAPRMAHREMLKDKLQLYHAR